MALSRRGARWYRGVRGPASPFVFLPERRERPHSSRGAAGGQIGTATAAPLFKNSSICHAAGGAGPSRVWGGPGLRLSVFPTSVSSPPASAFGPEPGGGPGHPRCHGAGRPRGRELWACAPLANRGAPLLQPWSGAGPGGCVKGRGCGVRLLEETVSGTGCRGVGTQGRGQR